MPYSQVEDGDLGSGGIRFPGTYTPVSLFPPAYYGPFSAEVNRDLDIVVGWTDAVRAEHGVPERKTSGTPDGGELVDRYSGPDTDYPEIIDPRTGLWQYVVAPEDIRAADHRLNADGLTDQLDQYISNNDGTRPFGAAGLPGWFGALKKYVPWILGGLALVVVAPTVLESFAAKKIARR